MAAYSQMELNLLDNFNLLPGTSSSQAINKHGNIPSEVTTHSENVPTTTARKSTKTGVKRKAAVEQKQQKNKKIYIEEEQEEEEEETASDLEMDELNKIGMCISTAIKPLREMEVNFPYPINEMKIFNHLKWPSVLVDLEGIHEEGFAVFLPKRVAERITPAFCESIQSKNNKYALVYLGELDTGKANHANLVQFKKF